MNIHWRVWQVGEQAAQLLSTALVPLEGGGGTQTQLPKQFLHHRLRAVRAAYGKGNRKLLNVCTPCLRDGQGAYLLP